MKQLFTLVAFLCYVTSTNAQSDSTLSAKNDNDTIRIGNIIIINKNNGSEHHSSTNISVTKQERKQPKNVSTNWLIVDLGFSNYVDRTNYSNTGGYLYNRAGAAPLGANDFNLNVTKSLNVNIWFFMQRLNLIQHHVNLKYGLGIELNNYRYNSNISYRKENPFVTGQTPAPTVFRDSVSFSKNKLGADYVTVPLMINFCTNPVNQNKGFSISVGVSGGFLYNERNKQISGPRGKQKAENGLGLEQFKFSYIGEIGLGPVRLYGSYSPTSFYRKGLDMRPYTLGIRLSNW